MISHMQHIKNKVKERNVSKDESLNFWLQNWCHHVVVGWKKGKWIRRTMMEVEHFGGKDTATVWTTCIHINTVLKKSPQLEWKLEIRKYIYLHTWEWNKVLMCLRRNMLQIWEGLLAGHSILGVTLNNIWIMYTLYMNKVWICIWKNGCVFVCMWVTIGYQR